MSRSFATVLAGVVIVSAIIKLILEDMNRENSRVAATGEWIRATAAERVTDPRAQILDSVDSAISTAASELSGQTAASAPSEDGSGD